jgi:pyridinium-3,5-biscarboxylic acid mononucleotide sulfurtransferase
VRHHGVTARLECEPEVFDQVLARRGEVIAAVRGAGFTFVALDLEGFRSGSMNRLLTQASGAAGAAEKEGP